MNKVNFITLVFTLAVFASGWYLGSSDENIVIASSVGGKATVGDMTQRIDPVAQSKFGAPKVKRILLIQGIQFRLPLS